MDSKIVTTWRDKIAILNKPLTPKELDELKDKQGNVTQTLEFDLGDIIDNDIEWLNDEVSERITGSTIGLTDISFKAVGAKKSIDKTFIKVTGNVEDFLAEELNAE